MDPVAISIRPQPVRRFGPARADCTPPKAHAKLDAAFKDLAARPYTRRDLRRAFIALLARSSRRHRGTARSPARFAARAPHRPAVHRHGGAHAGDDGGGDDPPPAPALQSVDLAGPRADSADRGRVARYPLPRDAVSVVKDRCLPEWLAIHGSYGWSFGSRRAAVVAAVEIAANCGVPIRFPHNNPAPRADSELGEP